MATLATTAPGAARVLPPREHRFFATLATVMALVVVAGFSTQLAAGRSTFGAPLRVHVHAVAFMGWVALFVTQSWFATRGSMALHRRLGWFSLAWVAAMIGAAGWVIVALARAGQVPFFFLPQQFLIGDPLTLAGFVGLTGWAIAWRRRTDWHARLHVGAMATLMGPAFGRLIPMPLLTPYSLEIACLLGLVFPLAGMIWDLRRRGTIHRAWWAGGAAIIATLALTDLIAYSRAGEVIYRSVTANSPGAAVPGLAFPPPPDGTLRTGR